MLRHVGIQNFIHFRKYQHLTFTDGANFINGSNSTGKSSIFKLIRRCLARSENTSNSSIANRDEVAYVLCKYDLSPELAASISEIVEVEEKFGEKVDFCELYTGIFVEEANKKEQQMYKILYTRSTSKWISFVDVINFQNDEQNELNDQEIKSYQIHDNTTTSDLRTYLRILRVKML